jgi:Tfp pilus assembly protein PilF
MDFSHAMELDSDIADYPYYRAQVKFLMKNYNAAIIDYTKAIKIEKNYRDAYYGRANAFQIKGHAQRACEDFFTSAELGHDKGLKLFNQYCK